MEQQQNDEPADKNEQKEYVAPHTKGQWIWENNPHEDRTDGFK